MRDSPKEWRTTDFDIGAVDKLASDYIAMHGCTPEAIYISPDIYAKMRLNMGSSPSVGVTLVTMYMSFGMLPVEIVPQYNSLLYVGTKNGLERILIWDEIDREFEKEVLNESSTHDS